MTKKTTESKKNLFKPSQYIVYPSHGVGKILSVEESLVAGIKIEMFVIKFEKDKMTLRVPTSKALNIGMRSLASPDVIEKALETLTGRAKTKRAMWSRRAMEYETKINSGDIVSIAEVVRDLHRSITQPDQSYSERQIYEAALARLSRELAAIDATDEINARKKVEVLLEKRAA